MYEKQILSRQLPPIRQQPPPSPSSAKQLMQLWLNVNVNDTYQSIVLEYLDRLPAMAQWTQIDREIRKTNQQTSYYHRIENLKQEFLKKVQELRLQVNKLQEWSSKIHKKYPYMETICDLLDAIRKLSMLICEQVTSMFANFKYDPQKNPTLGSYYLELFSTLNTKLQFLKKSTLAYYIPFSDSYDPLLVDALKRMNTRQQSNTQITDQNVEQLFQINASYLYRLLRSHQKMTRYLALSQYPEPEEEAPRGYARNYSYNPEPNRKQLQSQFKQMENKYKETYEGKIEDLKYRQKDQPKKIDKRRIVRCQPVTIFYYKDRHNQPALSRQSRDSKMSQKEEQGEDRTSPETAYYPTINDRTDITLEKSRKQLQYNKRSKTIEEHSLRKTPETSKRSNSFVHKKTPNKCEKSTNISDGVKLSWIKEDQECTCRQKHNKLQMSISYDNITESDYQQTRKGVIQAIKQKYKEMAKKEIRYELSKLGDHTYHRMKSRMLKKKNHLQHTRLAEAS